MGDDHDDDGPRFKPPHMPNNDLNSKIMLTAIISLSIVVILVTVLHIYARCVLRRQARRRAGILQLGIAITSQVHSIEPAKTGLDPTVIAALPMFLYKQSEQTIDREQGEVECAVCLSILEDGEMARVLPNCNHTFHAECIDRWFGSNSTCPICRTKVEPQQLCLSTSEGGSTGVVVPPSAPPLNSGVGNMEGTSDGGAQSIKTNGSTSRLSSFRKMLGKEKLPSEGDSGGLVSPSAPPLNSNMEGTSSSRLSSFRKMLSREKSSKRIQSCAEEEMEDIERQ